MRSPLSSAPPQKLRDLPRHFLLDELERYFQQRPPESAVETDYELWRCAETGLEFAWPMRPGGVEFYEWIARFDSYYPGIRWEYGEVARIVETNPGKILDVGCGAGDFLRMIGGQTSDKFALDLNEASVAACKAQGFNSFCGTIETALKAGFVSPGKFQIATAFHCLEHVDDPVAFVRSLLEVVAPGGTVFLSTPYSPMSFESVWFDILNHPPHHMTRWNLDAYQKLARLAGAKMTWAQPPSSALRRTIQVFRTARYGSHRAFGKISKPRFLLEAILHAPTVASMYLAQRQRGENGSGISADVILVRLTRSET